MPLKDPSTEGELTMGVIAEAAMPLRMLLTLSGRDMMDRIAAVKMRNG